MTIMAAYDELDAFALSGATHEQCCAYYRAAVRQAEQNSDFQLIDYLTDNYLCYLDLARLAPMAYAKRFYKPIQAPAYLERYISETQKSQPTYRALLLYFRVTTRIKLYNEEQLITELIKIGFNELSFIDHIIGETKARLATLEVADQITFLRDQRLRWLTFTTNPPVFTDWQHPATWLAGWAAETISDLQASAPASPSKIKLNLSVAQLGCVLWLLFDTGFLGNINLQTLFRTLTGIIETKRQADASPGGLSKAYYHIDQKTAATVRDLLLRLADHLTKKYFP